MPKRKNAFSKYTTYELFWAVDALEKDETTHALILTGARDPDSDDPTKEAFCSGGYFHPEALAHVSDEIRADIDVSDIAEARMTLKMWQCEKPLIDAVTAALDLENKGLNEAFRTSDFREALAALKEKRPPRFKGK